MNGTKEFLLGILVAAALIFLWRKEQGNISAAPSALPPQPQPATCLTCGPSAAASPNAQADVQPQAAVYPSRGTVSPGTPPLGGAGSSAKDTSFLASGASGSNLISYPVKNQPNAGTSQSGSFSPGTAGAIPPRSVEIVGQYSNLGFSHVTGTNLTNANNVGTPVPAGFPTNQLYGDVAGNLWRYNASTGVWFNTGTIPKTAPAQAPSVPPLKQQQNPVSQIVVNRLAIGTRRIANVA